MKTKVQFKVRQALRSDFYNDSKQVKKGVIYLLKSGITGDFCRCRSTSEIVFDHEEFRLQFLEGMVYVQQIELEIALDLLSHSITVPVRLANIKDLAWSATEFKIGLVYFRKYDDGTVTRRMKRIGTDTHFGEFAKLIESKSVFIQESTFKNQITFNNPAFAKAETQQAS